MSTQVSTKELCYVSYSVLQQVMIKVEEVL